jgi:anti-sigma factor RsiW
MMMFRPGAHKRFRESLSPYLDGELEARAAERLEAHLAACEGCRLELRQLRATAAALRELPEVQVPRSFALSPERAAVGRRPLTGAAAPLALGMRLAAAGVAVALAAVLVVDLGGFSGDNQAGTTAQQTSDRNDGYSVPTDSAAPSAEGAGTPRKSQTPAAGSDTGTPSTTSEVQPSGETGGGDGIGALTAAEIALGVTLGLLVLGALALAFAGRKT